MKQSDCSFERVSHIGVGVALMFIALGLSVIGVTVLPVLGFIVCLPVFIIAAYFFTAPGSPECRIN